MSFIRMKIKKNHFVITERLCTCTQIQPFWPTNVGNGPLDLESQLKGYVTILAFKFLFKCFTSPNKKRKYLYNTFLHDVSI